MRATIATWRRISVLAVALSVLMPASPAQATGAPTLTLEAHQVEGYVNLTVAGPPGATVALFEQVAAGPLAISTLSLPATGREVVAHAVAWKCSPRARRLVAMETSPSPATATLTVDTRSCAHRLAVALPHNATVSRYRLVPVRDR